MNFQFVSIIFLLLFNQVFQMETVNSVATKFLVSVCSYILGHSGPLFRQIRRPEKIDDTKARPEKPNNAYDLLVHPLKPLLVVKQFEQQPFQLPRNDDTFYWRTKRNWKIPFAITLLFCVASISVSSIWLYFELRPYTLPLRPVDQSTFLSRLFSR